MRPISTDQILDFLKNSPAPLTKREIGQAFDVKGSEGRIALKKALKALEDEGLIVKQAGGAYGVPDALPAAAIIEVTDIDIDGDVFARPVEWNEELQGPLPRIEVMPDKKGHPTSKPGDRLLARLDRVSEEVYEARVIKRLDREKGRVLGIIKVTKRGAVLIPTDKKAKNEFDIPQGEMNNAEDGDLAVGEIQPSRGMRNKRVRIVEVLGRRDDPKAISLISLHEVGLNEKFPEKVIAETKGMNVPPIKGRDDLRDIPLITIDGADARDFDDAVFAERHENGFHLIVAIADVAYYVQPGSPLDNEAQKRGNSTYFPDRVVPMLPEALSNDLCSLRPNENRACLAAHLWIDEEGKLIKSRFVRGLMKSAARLTYEQVQAAIEGQTDELTAPLVQPVLKPLYEAYEILDTARQKRGALDLDLPERQILIDENGVMTGVKPRVRLDSHKLIEEFMVLANVAAASALETKRAQAFPCVYRVHDKPSLDKLDSVRDFLESFELSLPKGQVIKPAQLNQILGKAKHLPYTHLINEVILRSQSQAFYTTDNVGHFGLALSKYAHFTSPIRRYADLMVHRALISAYGLGPGGMDEREVSRIDEICQHISGTERTSMEAERNAMDRFTSSYLASHLGSEFAGRISGVTRFGLFIRLHDSGADGLVPMRSLPGDFYDHDEDQHALIGRRTKRIFRLGAEVMTRIIEADPITGSSVLELVNAERGADIPGFKPKKFRNFDKKNLRNSHKKPRKNNKRKNKR